MTDMRFRFVFVPHPPITGARTTVTLEDQRSDHPEKIRGTGGGDSRETALLDLWRNLRNDNAPDDVMAAVEGSYHRLTGKMPLKP